MKRYLVTAALVLYCASGAGAAIMTSFSQSALYFRLLSRNASTDLDAAYYNPAGLTHLRDGFHVALHSAGYLRMKFGLGADYQQVSTFMLSNYCLGVGGRIRWGDKTDIDIGGFWMNCQDFSKTISYGPFGSYLEKYTLTTFGFSIGWGYHF